MISGVIHGSEQTGDRPHARSCVSPMTPRVRWSEPLSPTSSRQRGELPPPRGWSPPPPAAIWRRGAWSSPGVSFRADLEDCPRHEIAADIGLIENTTAQLLCRARRSLRSALDARA
jgi:hypothetical protein